MNEPNIEKFLRANKPRVKDDPTFMLVTRNKMDALEGIKDEVDRSRKTGRLAIIVALVIGLAAGAAASAFILLAPKPTQDLPQVLKYLIYALTVLCAIALGLILPGKGHKSLIG